VALLGLPDDTGVRLLGGRPGAARGPAAFRAALAAFGTTWDSLSGRSLDVPVYDAGDVKPAPGRTAAALFKTHARVQEAAGRLHEQGLVVVAIGGGHDLTLPTVAALAKHAGGAVGGINLDAHTDVRETVGSGMPFRRLIEEGAVDPRRFVVAGLGRFTNAKEHLEWLATRGSTLASIEEVLELGVLARNWLDAATGTDKNGSAFVSIDLDVLDGAQVPGVSALNPVGVPVPGVCHLAEAAGADPRVRHFDLMELSPPHDPSGRSARVAALLFLSFMAGFATRAEGRETRDKRQETRDEGRETRDA
jgi:formiminoglutamase